MKSKKIHHGKNIRRIRELMGLKQEGLADALNKSQQYVSVLERMEEVDEETLNQVAKTLDVPVEALKNMNEEATQLFISSFNSSTNSMINPVNCNLFSFESKKKDEEIDLDKLTEIANTLNNALLDINKRLNNLNNVYKDRQNTSE